MEVECIGSTQIIHMEETGITHWTIRLLCTLLVIGLPGHSQKNIGKVSTIYIHTLGNTLPRKDFIDNFGMNRTITIILPIKIASFSVNFCKDYKRMQLCPFPIFVTQCSVEPTVPKCAHKIPKFIKNSAKVHQTPSITDEKFI